MNPASQAEESGLAIDIEDGASAPDAIAYIKASPICTDPKHLWLLPLIERVLADEQDDAAIATVILGETSKKKSLGKCFFRIVNLPLRCTRNLEENITIIWRTQKFAQKSSITTNEKGPLGTSPFGSFFVLIRLNYTRFQVNCK